MYLEARDTRTSFDDLLFRLAQLEGVYVPRFYKISYQSNHSIDKIEPTPGVQARVERRYIKDIDQYPTTTVIQTPQTEFKSMFINLKRAGAAKWDVAFVSRATCIARSQSGVVRFSERLCSWALKRAARLASSELLSLVIRQSASLRVQSRRRAQEPP